MSLVTLEKTNKIATITLNSPSQLNAMCVNMGHDFSKIIANIKTDPSIRCVILTGAGRAFSSGGNLEMIREKFTKSAEQNYNELKNFYQTFLEIRQLPQPVIAAINGSAVGAGFCLALACDLRYASETAKMGANFAKIGLAPGMGGTYLITRLAGPLHAAEILMSGQTFPAEKMLKFGLLNDIFPAEDLMTRVQNIAESIANNGPIPVQQIKRGIQMAQHKTLEEMFDYDARMQAICFESNDIREGIAAVSEKREPNFLGK